MAKIYRQSDISEQDIFGAIGESAKKNMAYVEAIDFAIQKFTAHSKEILGKIDPSTLSGMNELVSVSDKLQKQTIATISLEKEKVKLAQLEVKAEQARVKAEQARAKSMRTTTVEDQKLNIQKSQATAKSKAIAQMQLTEAGSLQQLEAKMKLVEMALNRLTPEQIENTKQGQRYLASLTATRAELQKQQASYGKHTLNVGNYKSAFDGLGMSINQLTREMPAFANSFQTGFMAISNNLPMFFDEIQKIKQANIDLAEKGQQPISIFKRLGQSIFSLQSLLSVGVTLLTVYGAKLIDYIFNTEKAEAAEKKLAERKKILNEESKRHNEFVANESSSFVSLIYQLKQTNINSKERSKLINEINSKYGTTLKNLKDETKFQAQLNLAVAEYISLKEAEYKTKKNEEAFNKTLEKKIKLQHELYKYQSEMKDIMGQTTIATLDQLDAFSKSEKVQKNYGKYGVAIGQIRSYLEAIERENSGLEKLTIRHTDLQDRINELTDGGKKYVEQNDKVTKSTNESSKSYKDASDQIQKMVEKLAEYQSLVDEMALSEGEKAISSAINTQLTEIAKSGEYSFEVIDKLIQQQKDLEIAIVNRRATEEIDAATSAIDVQIAGIKRNKALLEIEEKYGNLKRDAHQQLNDAIENSDSQFIKENQKQWEDYTTSAKKDAEDLADFRSKLIEKGLEELKKASAEREKIIDSEIAQSEKLAQSLQEQANNGVITAEKSLSEQNAITNKKMQEKQKEEQLQQRLEELKLLYQGTMNYVEKGDTISVAGGKAFLEVKGLKALAGLKGFFSGTKRTVGEELGDPILPGRDGHVIRVDGKEKILNPDQSLLTGNATTDEIVDGFLLSKAISGGLLQPIGFGAPKTSNDDRIVSAVNDLKRVIENKSEISIEANKISQTLWEFTQSERKGNQLIHNRYIHRKNHS